MPSSSSGRSPRARGNRIDGCSAGAAIGSIPAGAGKPRLYAKQTCHPRVDPRGRGETAGRGDLVARTFHRSPRARGNRSSLTARTGMKGSIPAGAGKPRSRCSSGLPARADPRGRGETRRVLRHRHHHQGRSPRARGNRSWPPARCSIPGSIPAGAGKPQWSPSWPISSQVDPRGRGETAVLEIQTPCAYGRSPRARGNPERRAGSAGKTRSIPAGAGKPPIVALVVSLSRVDPRGRGETAARSAPERASRGRSPRARGNHTFAPQPYEMARSIPAGAGKPCRPASPR